ncbi:MAG: RNB domain-containing ribonuclease [Desulfovibrio sp.]|nr:RNB domain-containing ribonuclease [Desulfovibrio sp.]
MASTPAYPSPGCVVEYLEDNSVRAAIVLEESGGRLRLLLPSRKEIKLAQNRILPWLGPQYPPSLSREEYVKILEERGDKRKTLTQEIDVGAIWEMTQGEVNNAETSFFAELLQSDPDADQIAAAGRALLECKTRFRFQPPFFNVYDAETVEKREREQKAREEREALISGGSNFLRHLWEVASRKKAFDARFEPDAALATRLEKLLRDRMINPDTTEDDALWQMVGKSLPEAPHLPLQLLIAWGKLPRHYNFWLDRAGYEIGDDWWKAEKKEVDELAAFYRAPAELPFIDKPFVSVDGASTKDIDDAFHVEASEDGWTVSVALANPALRWPFGDELDKKVLRRATSVYLPEGDLHMLPEILGENAFSLMANEPRPAFCLNMKVAPNGEIIDFRPEYGIVKLAANLTYDDVEAALNGDASNSASPFANKLIEAGKMALVREKYRIDNGAIIMRKAESKILLNERDGEIIVELEPEAPNENAVRIVSELMVAVSSEFAKWAGENEIPVIYRTQNVTVPREFAGIWDKPDDIARIMRSLTHSILEIVPRPHAALGAPAYSPVTSPIRRYADLINEAQALHFLDRGFPRWNEGELEQLLDTFSPSLEGASQAQRFRPRYWRLWHMRQQGEKKWWPGVITEENDNFVVVSIPDAGLILRGRRALFDERALPGMPTRVRVGKVNPLYNEIHILEASPLD